MMMMMMMMGLLSAGHQQHRLHPQCISAAAASPADLPHPEPTMPTRVTALTHRTMYMPQCPAGCHLHSTMQGWTLSTCLYVHRDVHKPSGPAGRHRHTLMYSRTLSTHLNVQLDSEASTTTLNFYPQ